MFQTSYIEISKSAYKNNLNFIKNLLGKETIFSSVIKGNAYGHGIEQMLSITEKFGVDHYSAFSADEALRVFQVAKTSPTIMIMGYIDLPEIAWAIENDIEFYVFEMSRLEEAVKQANKQKKKAKIHIELETGMNRTGFEKPYLKNLILYLKKHGEQISIEGVCTHYAGAEEIANYVRINEQIEKFNILIKKLNKQGIYPKKIHSACSAAAMSYPKTQMDMARIGILQYGFWPSSEMRISHLLKSKQTTDPLNRLISWKSHLMEVKHVSSGEYIGYGTHYLATEKKLVGVVPVGYSNGYTRSLSNLGRVLINGCRAQVIGIVNMNLMMIDITDVPNTEPGDEVVLIGNQGNLSISVDAFTEMTDQLNYETLSRLPIEIHRKIVD